MSFYDVLIIGAGTAGLYTALSVPKELRVLVFSKNKLNLCNSALAQGGIAAVLDKQNDSYELHINDSLIAGGFENNLSALKTLVEEGPAEVNRLSKYGLELDKTQAGDFNLALEGGHSRHRIVHCKDETGAAVITALSEAVLARKNITVLENTGVVKLLKEDDLFKAYTEKEIYAGFVCVIATGGIGRIYKYSTNSEIATGDGIYFAKTLGAKIKNLSYIQFHPTAFRPEKQKSMSTRCFLLTEALRGEGAVLLDNNFHRFMPDYEKERRELAPRDIVSGCIIKQQNKVGSNNFYLDISHKPAASIITHFPMIYGELQKYGFDLTRDKIPIYPCQHYLMGGIEVNEDGETSVPHLFAAGECACTGVHGKNRLASNSLLEALVFPHRIAKKIKEILPFSKPLDITYSPLNQVSTRQKKFFSQLLSPIRLEIRDIMQSAFFVSPNYYECEKGLEIIENIKKILDCIPNTVLKSETYAMIFCAKRILQELLETK